MVGIVAVEPDVDVEQVALLAPDHPGECLALHVLLFRARARRLDRGVELIRFGAPLRKDRVDCFVAQWGAGGLAGAVVFEARVGDVTFSTRRGEVLGIAGLLGANRRNAMIAIGIIIVPAFARVVRAAVLEVMGLPFIESARSLGAGGIRIMLRHLIPNIVAPLIVLTTVYFSTAILAEATLSFLGLGTQPPEAAWGNMLATARSYIDQSVWMSIFPGLAIMIVVMGFNFLGDGLRDVLDPRIGGGVGDVIVKK